MVLEKVNLVVKKNGMMQVNMKNLDRLGVVEIPFFNNEECEKVIEYANEKEEYFIKENTDIEVPEFYSKNQVTTANFDKYNFFVDNPEYIDKLLRCLKETLPHLTYPIIVQSWVNIYKTGEGISWHNHHGLSEHSYTANIFIGGSHLPGVVYSNPGEGEFVIENKLGKMLLSHCMVWHMVPSNTLDDSRYSVGVTIHDYEAFTNNLLRGSCFNSPNRDTILLNEL